jgi:hypothetical protein
MHAVFLSAVKASEMLKKTIKKKKKALLGNILQTYTTLKAPFD